MNATPARSRSRIAGGPDALRASPSASAAILALIAALGGRAARADEPSGRAILMGTVQRARRAVAIGPMVGAGFAFAPSPDALEVPVSFGLGLDLFAIPVVPTPAAIEAMVQERVRARALERARRVLAEGQPPSEDDLARLGREVYQDVKAEVLGEMSVRPKLVERPRLGVALEGVYLPRAEAWQVRLGAGVGVKHVTIGPTIVLQLADADGLLLGGEVVLRLLPRESPRSPVIHLFLRADFGVSDATADSDQLGAGLRLLLDLL